MATTKHATIRYHALDLCFSNRGRKYYIDDLIEACNNALYDYTGSSDGIKRRQLLDDIKFMESDQGWAIELDRVRDGKKVFYRYLDMSYSIKKQAINVTEANQLKETLAILSRFKGMPQFEWVEEMLIRLESGFGLQKSSKPIIGFEQNIYLKGLEHFGNLFNAIQFKRVLEVQYQSFNQSEPVPITLHPYYLKQYNNRWFLFGYDKRQERISNLAIDRIVSFSETTLSFIENETIDFEEYFEDVVGVTVKENLDPIVVVLKIAKRLWPYIETKPMHGSQRIIERNSDFTIIELKVQPNYELESLIFSYGDGVIVLSPEELKLSIRSKAESVLKNY